MSRRDREATPASAGGRRTPSPVRSSRAVGLSASHPIHASRDTLREVRALRYDMHYGLEFGIVLSGRMRRCYRTWEAELGPGDVWYCGTWERHGWAAVQVPCEVLVVTMLPQVLAHPKPLESIARDWLAPFAVPPECRPRTRAAGRQRILALAQQLDAEAADRGPRRDAWLRLLTFEALTLLAHGWAGPPRRMAAIHSCHGISPAVELVFSSPRLVTTEEAAQACAMGDRTFRRAFEGLMGISFAKFALRHRLSSVAAELAHSDAPLKAIAARWGFVDASHLHRCFIRHYRCTPTSFRQRSAAGGTRGARRQATGRTAGGRPWARPRSDV